MADKILFEFRARRDEDGFRFEFRPGGGDGTVCGPFAWAGRGPECGPCGRWVRRPEGTGRARERTRSNVRETLDLFERMYRDLYGGDDEE